MKHLPESLKILDDATLLDAYDHACKLPRPWRELALLAHACGTDVQTLAQLPLGRRDELLLEWRAALFGSRFGCETLCPACQERIEFSVDIDDLRSADKGTVEEPIEYSGRGYALSFRLPNSADIAACSPADDGRVLLERCITSAKQDERELPLSLLPDEVRADVIARMNELDPQAEIQMNMVCPECHAGWSSVFDGAEFFLREIAAYTGRLLMEVHQLALSYGWREVDILAMNPRRRRRYLELMGAS